MDAQIVLALNGWVAASAVASALVVAAAQYGLYLFAIALALSWLWPGADAPTRRQAVLAALVSLAIAGVMVVLLGHLVMRVRPFVALGLTPLFPHGTDSSFPSDHTLASAALALPILLARPRIGVWMLLWALLVGFARVAAGVHYPTDVLGSAALAIVPAALALALVAVALSRVEQIRPLAVALGVLEAPPRARTPRL
jgi:undecaprenyl-diphosphatase